ncbi:YTH domain-containing protein ECT4 isoform X2 [Magnolia sinica]|nr:YTH domain-containing protein ECT4 isoform X2 [Magnolia sinica]XP_058076098.1 YTH domain-containing protein ECT4 isoform X2 [Magnolia sinica]
MDNEVAPEFLVDQGPYYPAAANYYGYYCTGFESPSEWDDHHRFFGLDGPDLHYTGLQTEGLPYVYYTPSYGYAQSPYNPYNPYIPGAVVGVDGPFVGAQQYYTGPSYQHPISSPAYFPIIVQPRPDMVPNTALDPTLVTLGASSASITDGTGLKHVLPSTSMPPRAGSRDVRVEPSRAASHQIHSSVKISEGSQSNLAPSKQPASHGTNTSSSIPNPTSSHVTQGRSASGSVQVADPSSFGRVSSVRNPLKVTLPPNTSIADFGSNAHGWAAVDKLRPRLQFGGGVLNNGNGSPDVLGEQNRGPRTNRLKSPWTSSISVKAYTTKAGASNAQGNIVIYADHYNREDFPINYPNAKFFVIKSYSEDDVHKSIKYSVWSSTPSGNKRLDSAYEDAQRISGGRPGNCPIFLFFSVNASGQFCGVAEMTGPVDFQKDMYFWQQDKWNGSFPVKWHIIKDVPNANFRHIILENNENKPVTNSRDTQEIRYIQGMDMLNIFKNHSSKTSILDDFMYYEDRQKLMQEEKSRLLGKTYDTFFLPTFVLSTAPNGNVNQPSKATDEKPTKPNNLSSSGKMAPSDEQVALKLDTANSPSSEKDTKHGAMEDVNDVIKIGSLSIDSKDSKKAGNANKPGHVTGGTAAPIDVVTVGSMPVKVNGFGESSSGILTVGSIPIDPKSVKLNKQGVFASDAR